MKSFKVIQSMLINELVQVIKSVKFNNNVDRPLYYNELMGNTSFMLSGLLELLLRNESDWDSRKWFDDSILLKAVLNGRRLAIWGVMIWGWDTSHQWTEPFYFEIKLKESKLGFDEYMFLFSDAEKPEVSYERFDRKRSYWEPCETRKWK